MDWHADRDPSVLTEQARTNLNLLYGGKPGRQVSLGRDEGLDGSRLVGAILHQDNAPRRPLGQF
jgi:hypothetical protein